MNLYLKELALVSSRMGSDPMLIQGSGGNTSLKEGPTLWIKASGTRLLDAMQENIFVPVDIDLALGQVDADKRLIDQSSCGSPQADLRPSIEAPLHALMPHRAVLHSHPIEIIALSLLVDAQSILRDQLSDLRWAWIPYARPGVPLTSEVSKALASRPADVLILANHGLIVGGDTPEIAFALQSEIVRRLARVSRPYLGPKLSTLNQFLQLFPNSRVPNKEVIHSLATDQISFRTAQLNPPCPDHVVFCGTRPWIISSISSRPPQSATYGLIPDVGVILLKDCTSMTESMLQAQAEVYLRIPPGRQVNLLSDEQSTELLGWEAEQYRQAMANAA